MKKWIMFVVAVTAPGCVLEVEEGEENAEGASVATQSLLGDWTFDSCSNPHMEIIEQHLMIGRTVASSNAVEECVEETVVNGIGNFGPYEPWPNDPWYFQNLSPQEAADYAVRAARSKFDLHLICEDLPDTVVGRAEIGVFLSKDPETLELDKFLVDSWIDAFEDGPPYSRFMFNGRSIADVIWHEAMHQNGYSHGDAAYVATSQQMPDIVHSCINQVLLQSAGCESNWPCPAESTPLVAGLDSSSCACVSDPKGQGFYWESGYIKWDGSSDIMSTSATDDHYGYASTAGDFNGDGYQDLAVGAPNKSSSGRVFLYRGTPFGLRPWRVLSQAGIGADEPGDRFGQSLASGDFDDDGYDDLIVGAPSEHIGTIKSGAAFVFVGSFTGLQPNSYITAFPEVGDRFGASLAVGDYDADGHNDLAVSAPGKRESFGSEDCGTVYLWRGVDFGSTVLSFDNQVLQSNLDACESGDAFGSARGLAFGDYDWYRGDDLAVGASGEDGSKGAVYIYSSNDNFAGAQKLTADALAESEAEAGDRFGWSVAFVDLTGDGYKELAVGAPKISNGGSAFDGAVFGYAAYNGALWPWFVDFGSNGAGLGFALQATQTDASQGMEDLLATAVRGGSGSAGCVRGYIGQAHALPNFTVDCWIDQGGLGSNEPGDSFGYSLAAGDFDRNGRVELIAGAPTEEAGSEPSNSGAFFTYELPATHTENVGPLYYYTQRF